MADPLHGIEEDVPFDAAAADELAAQADLAASGVEGTVGARNFWTTHAMGEFRGYFSRLFQSNTTTANTDAGELADALRQVADAARRLKEEAEKEQERRRVAREWKAERDDRGLIERGWDGLTGGGDDPPVGPPADPQILDVPPASNTPRETPAPGSAGGGDSGTSSARPSDLRSFETWIGSSTISRRTSLATARGAYRDFVASCHWGSLDADGVFDGFSSWLDANDNDEEWARAVASAFEAAGSDGAVVTLSNSAIAAALQSAGVDASRQDLTIPAPSAIGNPGTTGYADDPVNTATGNFVENETDLAFDGGCAALVLTRSYSSLSTRTGAFGPGWASWTEAGLRLDDDAAALVLPDGREILFPRLGDGWDRATAENLWLARDGGGYVVTGNDGTRWTARRDGRLTSTTSASGATVRLVHERLGDQDRLVRLEHARGRSVTLTWEGERVTLAHASDGREVSYHYDDGGRLVAATGVLGTRRYGWDEAGLVATVTSEAGVVEVDNTYDARGRVTRQLSQHGRTSRYAYLPGRVTVVSDEDGTRSNTWIADRRGRLVGIVDAHENRQSTSYDAHGNRVLVTERDGSSTVSEHDERGRLVRRVLPSGADLRWRFDAADRVVEVVTEEGAVTAMSYEGEDRSPSLVVDPEGGETRLSWRDGLLSRMEDPTGVEITFEHDGHGDLLAVRAADGGTARFERDDAGRVVAATDPLGHRTAYDYDHRGLLTARHDPDGATWTFEHDAAGRRTAVVDPLGGRTAVEHGTHGEVEREIDPLGRATTRTYDDLGNLASVELPDGAVWAFSHDALSRLVETTSPTGATWTQAYDAVGSVVREVDPTGVTVEARIDRAANRFVASDAGASLTLDLDGLGRPVGLELADGSGATTRYDHCGRVVERTDPTGGRTTIERDPAGRAVAVTDAAGATRRFEHDRCGRLSVVVDPLGGRTTLERDLAGRVVRQVQPDGTSVEQDHDPVGRVIRRRVAGQGTTRVEYDAAGRVSVVHDPRFGRRTFRHDAAGRLVEVVDAHGGATTYEHDDADRVVAVVDPTGARTERTFDPAGRPTSETDPLGRLRTLEHDAAGRLVLDAQPTGRRLGWTYDEAGRLVSMLVDGETQHSVERDRLARRERVLERLEGGRVSVHELAWDAAGRIVERSRDGQTLRWERDATGAVSAVTTPDGHRTSYERDTAGRVVAVEHPTLGRAVLERDAAGHVVRAGAGGTTHAWERDADGLVVVHTTDDGTTTARTEVVRDDDGRVVEVVRDGVRTHYEHDAAGQLVAASTGDVTRRWRYDAAGRLVAETGPDGVVERVHDAAGQLVATRAAGEVTTYAYDDSGRRTRREAADGTVEEYAWDARGWLGSVRRREADGEERVMRLRVDALGELAEVGGVPVFWDLGGTGGLRQVGDSPVVTAGPLTGTADGWASPGWRQHRSGTDPWAPATATTLDNGITVGDGGELLVAGLEWLGARTYDQRTREFLSTDPLPPVPGAAWAANPYSYAGNDPLHALDPFGLTPVTDAELEEWKAENGGFLEKNWEYVAAAGLVIAGGVMVATGFGGPIGMGLIAAGVDTAVQKYTTGEVNWKQVAVSGVVGVATGGLGGFTSSAVRQGTMTASRALAINVGGNAAIGGVGNTASYAVGDGPKDARGYAGAFFGGALSGAASGSTGGIGVPGAHAAPSMSSTITREGQRFAVDAAGGFGGQVTQDLVSGNDVDYTQAGIKAFGYGASGSASRGLNHVFPEQIGVHGQHSPGTPPPWFLDDFGAEGFDAVGQAATDRFADAAGG